MNKKRILIIDDEEHILQMLRINMRTHGYDCKTALTGEEGIKLVKEYFPDLILLDVMLPGIDGVEVCRRLKSNDETKRIPVLMLSAKSQGQDKIAGLEGGADDYITKPFSLKELFLRISAALRQVDLLTGESQAVLSAGSVRLDTGKYELIAKGIKLNFTLTEIRIFHKLIKNKNMTVPREMLVQEIFDNISSPEARALDVHIRNIRKKLELYKIEEIRLETIRGKGYLLRELN